MKHKIEIEFDDAVDSLSAGLRIAWVSGKDRNQSIELSCGAGCGSPFMVFSSTNKRTKKTRSAVADIRPLVQKLGEIFSKL